MSEHTNTSGLEPLGSAVLLKPYGLEIKAGIIAIPDSVADRSRMVDQRAIVVAVGPECWKNEATPRAKPGDHVMIAKYAGVLIPGADGQQYRCINGNDVFLKITEGKQNG